MWSRASKLATIVATILCLHSFGAVAQNLELTVYTSLPDSELPTYFSEFEKDTGIKVKYTRYSSGELLAKIKAEKGNPQASLMYGGSYDTYVAAAKDGLLAPYQSPELANVPKEYLDSMGFANPFYVGAICFANNRDWFKAHGLRYPTSWDDLLRPEFKGQITMAHPATSGTSYTVLATLVQARGKAKAIEYFKALDKNLTHYTKSGSTPPLEVAKGEGAIAITFSHDGLKPAADGSPIELSFPKEGTGFEVGCVALIKGGPEREMQAAKRFIDWSISKRGQELFEKSRSFRLPVNRQADPPKGAVKVTGIRLIAYDPVWAGENRATLVALFSKEVAGSDNLK